MLWTSRRAFRYSPLQGRKQWHSQPILSRHSIETIVQNVNFPVKSPFILTEAVSDEHLGVLPSDLPPSSYRAPKLKTGEVQVTFALGSILDGQGWVLSLPITVSQILHRHINPPLPNTDSLSTAAPPQPMVLTNFSLLSISLCLLKGRKKRYAREKKTELLTMLHHCLKEQQMQKAGTILLLWPKQGQDFILSAFDNRIRVQRLMHTTFSTQFQEVHEPSTNSRTSG